MTRKIEGPAVLVVDDEPLGLILATDCIERLGFNAIPAPNADAALAILEHLGGIEYLFTDVSMPGSLDGIELAKLACARWPPVKVLIASGRDVRDLPPMPPRSVFLRKPYDLRALDQCLREVMA